MSDTGESTKLVRHSLPRDAFRERRVAAEKSATSPPELLIVTPVYDDRSDRPAVTEELLRNDRAEPSRPTKPAPAAKTHSGKARNPFDAYGERSSSRPYALRLPDPIDLVLRQIAAEERTHPLRVIDRILFDYLKRTGRLPPSKDV